jgi:hypothetical protein
MSKKQATIEPSIFGAEFVGMKHGIKMLRGLRYKICMLGIPLTGQSYVSSNNKFQVTTLSRPELTSKKKCNSICCHATQELVVMGESLVTHINSGENLANFLTKVTIEIKCCKLVSRVHHDI